MGLLPASACRLPLALIALLAGLSPERVAAERRIAFWPDAVPAAIQAEVDGVATLETVRELGRFHRVHGSPGYAAAADHMQRKAAAAGLADAHVERFPADGRTRYAHFRSYLGWEAEGAILEEVSPRASVLARFPDLPVALADYSQDADVTAEVVDVGAGTDPRDYAGKDVRGRLVLASGPLPVVMRRACLENGAKGLLSDFPNQTTAWSGDDRDLVRWGHLSPYESRNTFAFMLSRRQSAALRERLARGEKVVLHAGVRARLREATFDVVTATIPGTEPAAGDVILTAHLCHESAGANDNASGSAAILETGRALRAAITRGTLPAPRRTIRFLWTPEIAGAQAWLVANPDLARRLVAGVHMDMVGGLLATTHGTFHLSRAAESLPHVVNDIARAWFDDVVAASAAHAEHGGDPRAGLVWPPGSREAFLGDVRPLEMGSDHEVFQDAAFGVPMAYFHDWPDVTIHTNKDQPENLDPTKLGRVAYMGAGIAWTLAALPDTEGARLVALADGAAFERIARAGQRAAATDDAADASLFRREAVAVGLDTLDSIARLWPSATTAVREAQARLRAVVVTTPRPTRDARVPIRSSEVRGPIDVYYYDHLRETLGADAETETRLVRGPAGDVLAFEALNLVNGRRTVAEIRDVLSGRYRPVPVEEIGEYLDLLARANVVSWKTGPR